MHADTSACTTRESRILHEEEGSDASFPSRAGRARRPGADGVGMWQFEQVVRHVDTCHDTGVGRQSSEQSAAPPASSARSTRRPPPARRRSSSISPWTSRARRRNAQLALFTKQPIDLGVDGVVDSGRQERRRECQRHARQAADQGRDPLPAAASRGSRSTASGTTCPPTHFRRRRASRCRAGASASNLDAGKILAAIGDPAKLLDNASVSSEKVEGIDSDKVSGDVNIAGARSRPPPMLSKSMGSTIATAPTQARDRQGSGRAEEDRQEGARRHVGRQERPQGAPLGIHASTPRWTPPRRRAPASTRATSTFDVTTVDASAPDVSAPSSVGTPAELQTALIGLLGKVMGGAAAG